MPDITFSQFNGGLDVRRSSDTSGANQLRVMENAYITTGYDIKKRPGLKVIQALSPGTVGLRAANGKLQTFSSTSVSHAGSLVENNLVQDQSGGLGIKEVHYCDSFNNFIYAAIEYSDGTVLHHYLDDPGAWTASTVIGTGAFRRPTVKNGFRYEATTGGTTGATEPTFPATINATVVDGTVTWTARTFRVVDANCPNTKSVVKSANKLFAIAGNVVRFCASSNPRDWTTASNAGFLATGIQQSGATAARWVGEFQGKLVVSFDDGMQIWITDPDPAKIIIEQKLFNSGSSFHRSHSQVGGDLFFLSKKGFRSVFVTSVSNNLQDSDIGSPIDSLVSPSITPGVTPISAYHPDAGQYVCAIGNLMWVYSYSRSSKLTAWSKYTFSNSISDITSLDGTLYIRSGNTIYTLDSNTFTDSGVSIRSEVLFPFLDFKAPGNIKKIWGLDKSGEGSPSVSFLYDPRNESLETSATSMGGTTDPGSITPVELSCTHLGPRIVHTADEAFSLSRLTFYYSVLGKR